MFEYISDTLLELAKYLAALLYLCFIAYYLFWQRKLHKGRYNKNLDKTEISREKNAFSILDYLIVPTTDRVMIDTKEEEYNPYIPGTTAFYNLKNERERQEDE